MKHYLFLFLSTLFVVLSCQSKSNNDFAGYWVLKSDTDYLIKVDDSNHTIWAGSVPNMPKSKEEADKFINEHGDPLMCSYEERDGAIYAEYWDEPLIINDNGIVELTKVSLWNGELKKLWGLEQIQNNQEDNNDWLNTYWFIGGDFCILVKIQGEKVSMCDETPHEPKSIKEADDFLKAEFAYIQNAPIKIKDNIIYVYDKDGYYGEEGEYAPLYYIKGNSLYLKATDEEFKQLWGTESNSGSQSHINSVSGGNNLFSSKADVENYIRGAKFRSKGGDIISFSEQKELVVKPHDKSWEQKLTAPVVVESFSGTTAVLQGKVGNSVLRIDINAAEGTLRQSADKAVVYYNTKNGSQERVNQLKNIITSKEFSHMENDVYSNSTSLHVYVFNSNGSGTVALYRVEPIGRKLISRHDIDWEIDGERLKVYNHDEYGETDYFQISESLFGGYSIKNGNVVYD